MRIEGDDKSVKHAENRRDSATAKRSEEAAQPTGQAKTDAAVREAQKQEDRNKDNKFRRAERSETPMSIEEQARLAKEQADKEEEKREAEKRLIAAEVQKQLALNGRGLRG